MEVESTSNRDSTRTARARTRRSYLRTCAATAGLVGAWSAGTSQIDRAVRTLSIVGDGATAATYEVTVSGSIRPTGNVVNAAGASAEDAIVDGVHRYRFVGDLTNVRVHGNAAVHVDGRPVDPARLG